MREFTRWAALGGMLTLALALLSCEPRRARAHEFWSDGSPVPETPKANCCGKADAHLLNDDDIHLSGGAWHIKGYRDPIPAGRELPSPDGRYWAFWRDFEDGTQSNVYCLFVPKGTM